MKDIYEVGIVGAGFGGLLAALELKCAGRNSFVIFERAREVGGVWRDNVYPGCACDVRSPLYAIHSQPNPHWSSSYASQPEILQYLIDTVKQNDLQKHIRFNANIAEVRFLEEEKCWRVVDQDGNDCLVRMLILALGPHSRPSVPSFKGRETFKGTTFHSSAWDPSIDLSGKRVAVVGTGASAIQIVPNIAPLVSRLVVFQRSPPWIISRGERKFSSIEQWLFKHVPQTQKLFRALIYWLMEFVGLAFLGNPRLNGWFAKFALNKLNREVRDPLIRQKLTPNYKIGCKRVLISDDFYPTFNQPHVQLVTECIDEITADGLRTKDGGIHDVDHIVFATGFIVADPDNFLKVVGRGGRILTDHWGQDGAEAYLGINVAGYPNLALLLGPNSGLNHSSAIHVMESQMKYILQYVAELDRIGNDYCLDVKPEVQQLYNIGLQDRLRNTVWLSGCTSWYLNRNGKNTTLYPGLTVQYRRLTARFNLEDYLCVS
jgi:cation diffusion facilitator CzcD-associated flavoprotein CzcO